MRPSLFAVSLGVVAVLLCCCCPQSTLAAARSSTRVKQRIVIHDSVTPIDQQRNNPHRHQQQQQGTAFDHHKGFRSGQAPVASTSNSKNCPARSVLRVDFTPAADGDGRLYGNIFGSGVLLATAQDVFEYEIMWKDARCNCGAEFEVGTQYRLRDNGPLDALGFSPHSERNGNMSKVAYGRWYKRRWSLAPVEGKYIDKFVLSAFGTPGVTVSAYFKYIRIVRGDEKRRIVFDSGTEPPNVTPYFPGTIVNSCQHELTLEGSSVEVVGGRPTLRQNDEKGDALYVHFGDRLVISGMVTSRMLSDADSNEHTCQWFAPVFEEFRWISERRDERVRITAMQVHCRMGAPFANLVLFEIAKWKATSFLTLPLPDAASSSPVSDDVVEQVLPRQSAPWKLHAPFQIPHESPLTHLLNGSWVDVSFDYYLVLDGWVSPEIRTVVRSYRLFLL
jgi:hypothetical protein